MEPSEFSCHPACEGACSMCSPVVHQQCELCCEPMDPDDGISLVDGYMVHTETCAAEYAAEAAKRNFDPEGLGLWNPDAPKVDTSGVKSPYAWLADCKLDGTGWKVKS